MLPQLVDVLFIVFRFLSDYYGLFAGGGEILR